MRITVLTTGEAVFEDATTDEALALLAQLRNGAGPSMRIKDVKTLDNWAALPDEEAKSMAEYAAQPIEEYGDRAKTQGVVTLSRSLAETWEWIAAQTGGTSTGAVAMAMDISRANASFRLKKLVSAGAVKRVSRGRYRAVGGKRA